MAAYRTYFAGERVTIQRNVEGLAVNMNIFVNAAVAKGDEVRIVDDNGRGRVRVRTIGHGYELWVPSSAVKPIAY